MHRFFHKCSVVVVKRTLNSTSKPCRHCLDFLKKCGIKKVYYSYEGNLKMEKVSEMETTHISAKYRKPWSEFSF